MKKRQAADIVLGEIGIRIVSSIDEVKKREEDSPELSHHQLYFNVGGDGPLGILFIFFYK